MSNRTAEYWINKLQLTTHIEGGAFRRNIPLAGDGAPAGTSFYVYS